MIGTPLHIKANAKVNLTLRVGKVLETGMHPIESKMARVAFSDAIELTRLDSHAPSRYAIFWHENAPRKSDIDWSITDDLAVRAHRLLESTVNHPLPIQMKLEKHIPVGGGLGGGSADAASMLIGLCKLFELNLDLDPLALSLGSDVPFLLHGETCDVRGVGEETTPLAFELLHLVLIFPSYSCITQAVYRAFDSLQPEELLGSNDLLAPAFEVAPQLAADFEALSTISGQEIHLSGSGSTMFAICHNAEHASELARKIEKETECVARVTQTCQETLEKT